MILNAYEIIKEFVIAIFSWFVVPLILISLNLFTLINYEIVSILTSRPIDVVEEDIPFMKMGKTVDQMYVGNKYHSPYSLSDKIEIRSYQQAIWRFPTAESCLLADAEGDKDSENFSNVDWYAINTDKEAEVCMFRIHSRLGDPQASIKWFEQQGFKTSINDEDDPHRVVVNGYWRDFGKDKYEVAGESPFRSLFFTLAGVAAYTGITVSLEGYENGHWNNVQIGFSYL